jgi:hypothetical protein
MFRDNQEELKRLEQALLEEEETPEEVPEQEIDWQDTRPAEVAVPYRNFSNGYRAYNTDKTDTDFDEYAQQVHDGRGKNRALVVLASLLGLGIGAVVIYLLLRYGGIMLWS